MFDFISKLLLVLAGLWLFGGIILFVASSATMVIIGILDIIGPFVPFVVIVYVIYNFINRPKERV